MKTYINSFCFIWRPFKEPELLPDFSKHLFRGREFRDKVIGTANGVTRQNVSKPKLLAIKIPVPPVEIQKDIVAILDKFTELESELKAELEAELKARKKQFAYLLDYSFDNDQIRKNGTKSLSSFGEFDRGNGLQKADFSESGTGCIHYGQIYTKFGSYTDTVLTYVPNNLASKLKRVKPGNLVVTTTSENIQDVCKSVAWLGSNDIVVGGHSCIYRHSMDPLFATYLFRSRLFQDQKNSFVQGTKVKDIKPIQIGRILVYVPDLDSQVAIGKMLQDFDNLIMEIDSGLPAEIATRRQQYEYYRNKLLTFKELDVA
jgi:type I restriction enzyme S subunit